MTQTQNISSEDEHTPSRAVTDNGQDGYEPTARTAQEYILQNTPSSGGLTFGYVRVNEPTTSSTRLMQKVQADSFDYQPIVLYSWK